MPGPAFTVWSLAIRTFEIPACVRFEFVHNSLRLNVSLHDYMHVVGSHVSRQQTPATVCTVLSQRGKDRCPTAFIQPIWRLCHTLTLCRGPPRIGIQQTASVQIVMSIDGTRLCTMQVRPVARESNEIPQKDRSLAVAARPGVATTLRFACTISLFAESVSTVSTAAVPTLRRIIAKAVNVFSFSFRR